MNTVDAVKVRILQLCAERNITINISGLPPSSLKGIIYGRSRNPKILTIKIICDGLRITLTEFLTLIVSTHWNRISNNNPRQIF